MVAVLGGICPCVALSGSFIAQDGAVHSYESRSSSVKAFVGNFEAEDQPHLQLPEAQMLQNKLTHCLNSEHMGLSRSFYLQK